MSYPSDISREQFEKIKPILESTRNRTRPREMVVFQKIETRIGSVKK